MEWISYFPFLCVTSEKYGGYSCVILHFFPKSIDQICVFITLYNVWFNVEVNYSHWNAKSISYLEFFALNSLVFLYYINVYKYVYEVCSLVTNVMIHKVQGFVNWFCTSTIDQIGVMEYTSFKYFPIMKKGSQMIDWHLKYKHEKCLLNVNSSKYQDWICMQHTDHLFTQSD